MGYAAARGGLTAIKNAERLVRHLRDHDPSDPVGTAQVTGRLRLLVDKVMGEAGMWDPDLAARALLQAEGDHIEATHLLRAYRSTLPRVAVALPVHADDMRLLRRIVPAFREPGGPQVLGRSTDYSARMLVADAHAARDGTAPLLTSVMGKNGTTTRLTATLRRLDLLVDRRRTDDPEPVDVTSAPPRPPAPRSARLSAMARAETGSLINQWYRNILGPDGYLHEVTLGEVRHGELPVTLRHPHTGNPVTIGHYRATEVEAVEDLDGAGEDRERFDVGFGICLGHNERKAIAMANLDIACHRDGGATTLEQSILMTTDGLDSAGFLEHLKLPHYVTFRSMIDRKFAVREARLRATESGTQ